MSYVDAHLHLADVGYQGQVESIIRDETNRKVKFLLSNGTDYQTSIETIELARRYAGRVLAAVGVHPMTVVRGDRELRLGDFENLVCANKFHVTAIGEVGMDGQYSQDEHKKQRQLEAFRFFLTLAERNRMPVVIHSRLAVDEVFQTLSSFNLSRVLMHWYSGPVDKLGLIQDRGYLISVGPSISYSKSIIEIARKADLRTILTETDGPVNYHGQFEGKKTQPSFVVEVVRKIAEVRAEQPEKIRDAIWQNFLRFIHEEEPHS